MCIDESIISDFKYWFCFIFLFYLFLFTFLELFYYNCLLFNFRNKYMKILSLGAKERVLEHDLRIKGYKIWFGADWRQKYEDSVQKYLSWPHRMVALPRHQSYQRACPRQELGTARAANGTTVRDIWSPFCCFVQSVGTARVCGGTVVPRFQLLFLVCFDLEAHGFSCVTLQWCIS